MSKSKSIAFCRAIFLAAAGVSALALSSEPYGIDRRVAPSTLKFPLREISPWGFEEVWDWSIVPGLIEARFDSTGANVVALSRSGGVYRLDLKNKRQTKLFTWKVQPSGFALHPGFDPNNPQTNFVYIGGAGPHGGIKLSRFTLVENKLVNERELVVLDKTEARSHAFGDLEFGPDRFLYFSIGDGADWDLNQNTQKVGKSLFSGIFRIDVENLGGKISKAISVSPQNGRTANYSIPLDNPFVGQPGVLEEFWALGFRNPWRMAIHPSNSSIFIGEVGEGTMEAVERVTKASNHQWSYREGSLPFFNSYLNGKKPEPFFGIETEPYHEYLHKNGNKAIIGGIVYDGDKFPEFKHRFLFADFFTGKLWSIHTTDAKDLKLHTIAPVRGNGSVGYFQSPSGDIYLGFFAHSARPPERARFFELKRGEIKNSVPTLLSQTGIFRDLARMIPQPGIYEYEVNSPLWSDGVDKRRWFAIPGDDTDPKQRIRFDPTGDWEFPPGSIFIKHFEIRNPKTNEVLRRLETRVLVRTESKRGMYAVTYKWNAEQTDALLIEEAVQESIHVPSGEGETKVNYRFPDRQECITCHDQGGMRTLGFNQRQLNRRHQYEKVDDNQIRSLNHANFFQEAIEESSIASMLHLVAIDSSTASLEQRVRSYFDSNCAHCHNPGRRIYANFDARFTTPSGQEVVNKKAFAGGLFLIHGGQPESSTIYKYLSTARMPELGVSSADRRAVSVLEDWILTLPPPGEVSPPDISNLNPLFFKLAP